MFQLQQLVLSSLLTYVPLAIAVVGIVVSIRAFAKTEKNNSGFLVVALVFTKPILSHLFWWMKTRQFVPVQIDADTWTAPGRYVDLLEPVFFAILLLAVWLIYRKYPTAPGGVQELRDVTPPREDS